MDLDKAARPQMTWHDPQEIDLDKRVAVERDEDEMNSHIQWMIDNLPDGEKGHRWLGFIQGAVWAMGYSSINDLREDNIEAKESDV